MTQHSYLVVSALHVLCIVLCSTPPQPFGSCPFASAVGGRTLCAGRLTACLELSPGHDLNLTGPQGFVRYRSRLGARWRQTPGQQWQIQKGVRGGGVAPPPPVGNHFFLSFLLNLNSTVHHPPPTLIPPPF